jgi:hypothetical protein
LVGLGHAVLEDTTVVDRPDLVFNLDGVRTGCELTTVTEESLESWTRRKRPVGETQVLRLPNSPGEWLANRIESKDAKAAGYRSLRQLAALWLGVHVGAFPAFGNDEETLQELRHVAAATHHSFDQVWLVGEKGLVRRLWAKGELVPSAPPNPEHDRIVYRQVTVQAGGGGVVFADLGDSEPRDEKNERSLFLRAAYLAISRECSICLLRGSLRWTSRTAGATPPCVMLGSESRRTVAVPAPGAASQHPQQRQRSGQPWPRGCRQSS